jgi:hypothetical protein
VCILHGKTDTETRSITSEGTLCCKKVELLSHYVEEAI